MMRLFTELASSNVRLAQLKVLLAALVGCLTGTLCLAVSAQKKDPHPNVFLITIDTLRADHVHCYGYEGNQTPALDDLARDGIRFAQAYTPSPITNTSHVSILTGLLPSSHGVTDFAVPLSPVHSTWAELLHRQGYHTAAFIGAVILDSKSLAPGLERGFDFYDNFPEHTRSKSRWGRVERRGMDVVQRAETWLTAHPEGPHFVWLHLYDPHDPYEPPAPFLQIYKDHLYDGEIAYADSALADFVRYLKRNDWYQNSLIVAVGDHGEGLGEHHEDTHGIFLYDSTTHVPLILKLPTRIGDIRMKVITPQVRTIDILPTVLEITHISSPSTLDGESLKMYCTREKPQAPERIVYGETDYPLRFGWAPLRSVRMHGLKFIEAPRPELYDLRQDAAEMNNRYEPWNPQVQNLRGLLAVIRGKEPASSGGTIEQVTIDELKALGYLSRASDGSTTNVPEPSLLPDPKDKIEEQNFLHQAMIASEDNRPHAAREFLTKAVQLDPKSPIALRQLGDLELATGDYAESAQHLKAALEINPNDSDAALHEGEALEKAQDLAGARDALEFSLNLTPGGIDARLLLGLVYLELKNAKAAENQFESALLLQPGSVVAQLGVAKAEIAEGNFKHAATKLNALSKLQPRNAEIFDLLVKAYSNMGRKVEAQQAEARAKLLRAKR